MMIFKRHIVFTLGLFFTLEACITPEPVRPSCQNAAARKSEFIFTPSIKAGPLPKSASEYNKLVRAGTTHFLLMTPQNGDLHTHQIERNLLALGYKNNEILHADLNFYGDSKQSCIGALSTLNQLNAFRDQTSSQLFITTDGSDIPLLTVLFDRFVQKRNLIQSYKNRVCETQRTCPVQGAAKTFYRLAKSMELASPAVWQRDVVQFCSNLRELDELDVKFVDRYLTCESTVLSAN